MNEQTTPPEESPWAALARPFAFQDIQVKVLATNQDRSRGLVVPFVDARSVMQKLDDVLGPEGWHDAYDVIAVGVVRCRLTILGIEKQDVGQGDDAKSAFSDSLKRAAVHFSIGRHLYDSEKVWVALDQRGQIADVEDAKRRVLRMPARQPTKGSHSRNGPLRSSDELARNGLPF